MSSQVSSPGYYRYKNRPLSPTQMRRLWLTGLINEVFIASRQTYGSRKTHAELTIGMKVQVRKASSGRPDEQSRYPRPAGARESETAAWDHHRRRPGAPQVPPALTERTMDYGLTEHPTREGKIYCCAVMDTFSRKIVGWSIDNA